MSVDMDHYNVPQWTLGDRLRKARAVSGKDQREFAELLGVKPGSLAGWETDRTRPRDLVAVAKRIEMALHIPAAWVLGVDSGPFGGPGGSAPRPGLPLPVDDAFGAARGNRTPDLFITMALR